MDLPQLERALECRVQVEDYEETVCTQKTLTQTYASKIAELCMCSA